MINEDNSWYKIVSGTDHTRKGGAPTKTQPQSNDDPRKLTLEYAKEASFGDFLMVGVRATHKGVITCRAMLGTNTIAIQSWSIDSEFTEIPISGAAKADKVECSYN